MTFVITTHLPELSYGLSHSGKTEKDKGPEGAGPTTNGVRVSICLDQASLWEDKRIVLLSFLSDFPYDSVDRCKPQPRYSVIFTM